MVKKRKPQLRLGRYKIINKSYVLNPVFAVAMALLLGMIAQAVAHHLRVPGIVMLFGIGMFMGPDIIGLILPGSLGPAPNILTGFSVAVIL